MEFLKPNKYKIIATIFFVLSNILLTGYLFCGFSESDPFCNNFIIQMWMNMLGAPLFTFMQFTADRYIEIYIIPIIIIQIIWSYILGCLTVRLIQYLYRNNSNLIIRIAVLILTAFILLTPVPLIVEIIIDRIR